MPAIGLHESYRYDIARVLVDWLNQPGRPWSPLKAALVAGVNLELEQLDHTVLSVVIGSRLKSTEHRGIDCELMLWVVVQCKLSATDEQSLIRQAKPLMGLVETIEDELLSSDRQFGDWTLLQLDNEDDEREPFSDDMMRTVRQFSDAIPVRMVRVVR